MSRHFCIMQVTGHNYLIDWNNFLSSFVKLKTWRKWPALFVQHQYLELGHFCLPLSPVAKSAWRNWQTSTEKATFACRQAKMFLIWIKSIFVCQQAKCACRTWNVWKIWWWRNERARTGCWNYLMLGKQCWSVSPGLNSDKKSPELHLSTYICSRPGWNSGPCWN